MPLECKSLLVGFGVGGALALSTWAVGNWISRWQRLRSGRCPRCRTTKNKDGSYWIVPCRSVEITIECVEESRKLATPIAIAGGMVCIANESGELVIATMSENLREFAGHAKTVADLLPGSFRRAHELLVLDLLRRKADPGSSVHPLNVRLVTKDRRLQDATIKLMRMRESNESNEFLIVILLGGDGGYGDIGYRQEEVVVTHFGGSRQLSRDYIRGNLNEHLSYQRLTVLFLDIKGFTHFVVNNT